ncbi:MAG: hypothetical protein PGN25_07740 [Methylorubrum populi]
MDRTGVSPASAVGTAKEQSSALKVDQDVQTKPEEALMASGNSTSKRGFASMNIERQREIASKGGRSVPAEKRSFSQDRELASSAGRKGGQSTGRTGEA